MFNVWEMAVHLAVAGDVFDGAYFVLSFFPRDVLDEIWYWSESVPGNFSYLNKLTTFLLESAEGEMKVSGWF